jgi:heterodisulfide reductase subunit C
MEPGYPFHKEILDLLHAADGKTINSCIQCATCSSACPVVDFVDRTPRGLILLISADMKEEVLKSNMFWTCASCYQCTEKCPKGVNPAEIMYALKRYSLWKNSYREGLIGPDFSRRFVKTILRNGKSYEPGLAPAFIFEGGFKGLMGELQTALKLLAKGRLPLIPSRIKRRDNFRHMLNRVLPLEGIS